MVAAKLDRSRVLVTKFRQNRLTLKGRSAGQRQTDRQTNSDENRGPSGFAIGPTDHTTRSVMTDRIFVGSMANRPKNEVLKCLHNRHTKNISSFHKLTCCQKPFAYVLSHKLQNQKRKSTVLSFVK